IPRALAPKAKAFGLKVIAHDPYVAKETLSAAGVEGVSFDDLLARSDFISVNAPLSPATRGLMNAAAFAKMKKGAFLINTARGPLVDESALIAALDAGQLGGAGLDVVASEPLPKDSPLRGRDNVILTPHTHIIQSRRWKNCRPNAQATWRACCPARRRFIRSARSTDHSAVQPPSSTSAEPVISDEASDARKTIAPVISSSCPSRPSLI